MTEPDFTELLLCIAEATFASLPRTARGVAIVVGGDPKGKNFLYTNGNSVIIRDIAVSDCILCHLPILFHLFILNRFLILFSLDINFWDEENILEYCIMFGYRH